MSYEGEGREETCGVSQVRYIAERGPAGADEMSTADIVDGKVGV